MIIIYFKSVKNGKSDIKSIVVCLIPSEAACHHNLIRDCELIHNLAKDRVHILICFTR